MGVRKAKSSSSDYYIVIGKLLNRLYCNRPTFSIAVIRTRTESKNTNLKSIHAYYNEAIPIVRNNINRPVMKLQLSSDLV